MASDLKIRFSSNFLLSFWWMQMCLATLRPLKFFKRKKRKKESHSSKWKVSKKQVFQKKYYPIRDLNRQRLIRMNIFWNCLGGDFFWNPQGLNLLFWIPGTYLCFLFLFIFFWNFQSLLLCNRSWIGWSYGLRDFELKSGRLLKGIEF